MKNGYTIIELLVTLMIALIFAAVIAVLVIGGRLGCAALKHYENAPVETEAKK